MEQTTTRFFVIFVGILILMSFYFGKQEEPKPPKIVIEDKNTLIMMTCEEWAANPSLPNGYSVGVPSRCFTKESIDE